MLYLKYLHHELPASLRSFVNDLSHGLKSYIPANFVESFPTIFTLFVIASEGAFTFKIDAQLIDFIARGTLDVWTFDFEAVEHGL